MKFNRRLKAGLFLAVVTTGIALLVDTNPGESAGFFLICVATSWVISRTSLRVCYGLLISLAVCIVVGSTTLTVLVAPSVIPLPLRYLLIVVVAFLISFLVFEWRVWRAWYGRRLGLVSTPRKALNNCREIVVSEMVARAETVEKYEAECLTNIANTFSDALKMPGHIGFDQAIELREELGPTATNFHGEPIPESVQEATKKVCMELTNELEKVAQRSGMLKEFQQAEETGYNLAYMVNRSHADEIMGPICNPISRPHVLRHLRKYESHGSRPDAVIDQGRQHVRMNEAVKPFISPYRWIAGACGAFFGWWLDGTNGLIVGGLVGQFSYPKLMCTISVINFLYYGRGFPSKPQ